MTFYSFPHTIAYTLGDFYHLFHIRCYLFTLSKSRAQNALSTSMAFYKNFMHLYENFTNISQVFKLPK
jgi:hypothetical protein